MQDKLEALSGISPTELESLRQMLDAGAERRFYDLAVWGRRREEVLRLDNWECQYCKARGRYSRATIVHHVKHLRDRPDLALSIWDGEERQLVSTCKRCHEEQHPESMQRAAQLTAPLTEERWD